ncbi:prolyl oligopeptidase family serine peptidase [Rudanella paleaurantiibacter]|uniref:Prolyl oligopeptidase family serine peptidase n=1 Tax=Rudanella paleaurantiibacter TaxID=2614655 RepID=A0A7J5U090_9BACT|nr:S9 family peptidase [Rudanella paleaurantiibacter]KAB7731163.1 prolyl oligopeptidase family serine peptidase [Rudanella paleaurantiibacter]
MSHHKPFGWLLWLALASPLVGTGQSAQAPAANVTASAKQRFASLQQALSAGGQLNGSQGPRSVNWIDNGRAFSYLDGQSTIKTFTPQTGQETVVFDASGLTFPGTTQKFVYQSFQWSKDSKNILFQTNFRPVYRRSGISDYYSYSVADKSLKLVAKDAQTAELAPDGSKIGYERGGNLFVFDFAGGKETQLTNDAAPAFYNGRFGWAYEEEFGLAQAWEWSPDSKFIAFWQSDERQVPIYKMTDYKGFNEKYDSLPYPRVGDTNPSVRIGVIEISNGKKQWMNVDLQDGYIPRIYWTNVEGQVALIHLNRKQNHLRLFMANGRTGEARPIMEEKAKTWIDVFDFFAGINHLMYFPAGVNEFYWVSDRDGYAHLYRYDYTGKLLNAVTSGAWEVTYVHHIDAKNRKVYYTSTEVSPLERQLYVIDIDGKNKRRLTNTPGRHTVNVAPATADSKGNGVYYIDRYSNTTTPTQVELWDTKGKKIKTLEANSRVTDFVAKNAIATKELVNFTTSDGQRIDISILKPADFDPNSKKYPVLVDIYGGPGAQSVYNDFSTSAWHQYLTQQGYVVVSVNNRGSGGYGRDFEKVVYEQLGKYESLDFAETAKYLAKQPWVDGNRMAIRGHSYGGYMSSYTMLTHPGVFKVSLVGAPVTDWRLYDSIYTERYMGLMPENEAKYKASAVTTYAKNLAGKMFVAHSTMDENVHVRNTFQLMNALEDEGKDADLRIYPPGAHGVAYNGASYVLLHQQYTDYLAQHLK